jgi:predicted ArsR family transcriptional regulator
MNKTQLLCINELQRTGKLDAKSLAVRVGVTYEHVRRSLFRLAMRKQVRVEPDHTGANGRPRKWYSVPRLTVKVFHD